MTANKSLIVESLEETAATENLANGSGNYMANGINASSSTCCNVSLNCKPTKLQHLAEEQTSGASEQSHFKSTTQSHCECCSTEGLLYYINDRYSWKSKCMRATIVILAALCTMYVCHISSQRFFHSYSWVQTVIGRTDMHVSEIPFPAVTICPIRNMNFSLLEEAKHKIFGTNNTMVKGADFLLFMEAMQQVLQPPENLKTNFDSSSMYEMQMKKSKANKTEIFAVTKLKAFERVPLRELLHLVSYECEELFSECYWRRVKIPCCDIFRKIQSFKGMCYGFNSMISRNAIETWPWMVPIAGYGTGLQVFLKSISSDEHNRTHLVMIHGPNEALASESIYLHTDRAAVAISPLRYTADADIVSLSPSVRHCFFTHELRKKKETQSSCLINCRLKHLEKHCNCTYFLADWISEKKQNLPVCGAANLECIYENRVPLLTTSNFFEEVTQDKITIRNCGCYPNCNYVDYRTGVHMHSTSSVQCKHQDCLRELQVNYRDDTFLSYHSMLRFTLVDLIVAFGGVAGLFLGLSFVGLFDVLQQIIFIICSSKFFKKSKQDPAEKM